jgi:hypothetical protein
VSKATVEFAVALCVFHVWKDGPFGPLSERRSGATLPYDVAWGATDLPEGRRHHFKPVEPALSGRAPPALSLSTWAQQGTAGRLTRPGPPLAWMRGPSCGTRSGILFGSDHDDVDAPEVMAASVSLTGSQAVESSAGGVAAGPAAALVSVTSPRPRASSWRRARGI